MRALGEEYVTVSARIACADSLPVAKCLQAATGMPQSPSMAEVAGMAGREINLRS